MSTDGDPAAGLDATMSAPGTTPRAAGSSPASPGSEEATPSTRGEEAELEPGATLGRYVLVERLGAGGMGVVFRARDPDLGRELAIKVLRTGEGSGGALERRLMREAQAMATVSHDNLATVYDILASNGRVFIAMELVDGGTLRTLIADPAKTWRDKLAAVVAAGRGLAAAHSAGVIHRDFKPDNVLIAKTGRVKVVDFGLARADRDATVTADGTAPALPADLSAHLTQTGALLGTPAYMAPEQHGGEIVDARSDQFAFAVTAWEAVYGQRPFASEAYSSLVAAVRAHDIRQPPRSTGVPVALDAVLRRALSPDPADRYTSMDAALDAIERAIRPRRRAPWIIAAAAAVLVGGGIATYAVLSGDAGTPDRAAAVKQQRAARGARTRLDIVPFDFSDLASLEKLDEAGGEELALSRFSIASVLRTHVDEGIACYEAAGLDRPGQVTIEFQIAADGKVESTRIVEDQFKGTDLASCIAAASMRWRFPPTGEATTVMFPFVFADDDGRGGGVQGFFPPGFPFNVPGGGQDLPGVPVPPTPPAPPAPPTGSPPAPPSGGHP